MRRSLQAVIAIADPIRKGCPARIPSPKKSPALTYAKGRLLARLGYYGESNLAFLNVEHSVSGVPLCEDCLPLGKEKDLLSLTDRREEFPQVEVALLGRYDVSRAVRHFGYLGVVWDTKAILLLCPIPYR
jgi:hypothetical protein